MRAVSTDFTRFKSGYFVEAWIFYGKKIVWLKINLFCFKKKGDLDKKTLGMVKKYFTKTYTAYHHQRAP